MYMQDKMVNTTACTIDTPVSRKNKKNTTNRGMVPINTIKEFVELNMTQLNPARTAKSEWPAIILANKRADKLTTRKV